jgi:hypothetical protein
MDTPETLQQAVEFFANPDNCHAYMVQMRWPDGGALDSLESPKRRICFDPRLPAGTSD